MRSWPERPQRRARIEIIPMIDVMMFLLVFFVLISINVLPALGLKVTPPSSERAEQVIERKKVMLTIDKEGHIFLDGAPVDLPDLESKLRALNEDKSKTLVIAGDGGSELQHLVDVLDVMKGAGISTAAIVARAK
jgi:biopolymer transport protein ExbD